MKPTALSDIGSLNSIIRESVGYLCFPAFACKIRRSEISINGK
jgi:hypothetical protein